MTRKMVKAHTFSCLHGVIKEMEYLEEVSEISQPTTRSSRQHNPDLEFQYFPQRGRKMKKSATNDGLKFELSRSTDLESDLISTTDSNCPVIVANCPTKILSPIVRKRKFLTEIQNFETVSGKKLKKCGNSTSGSSMLSLPTAIFTAEGFAICVFCLLVKPKFQILAKTSKASQNHEVNIQALP